MQDSTYLNYLKKHLSEKRVAHSLRVAKLAMHLAKVHGINEEQAHIAGILHDIGKGVSDEETLDLLSENKYPLSEDDILAKEVLHAPLGVIMVKQQLKISDIATLQAMERHTTGNKAMTKLDAVIYLADMLEPERDFPGVQELRKLAENDLYFALVSAIGHTITYLVSQGNFIHPRTLETYNWLIQNKKLAD